MITIAYIVFFFSIDLPSLIVYLGRQTQLTANSNEVSTRVAQVILHPGYDKNTHDNDIALLQLASTVTFTDYILPVCLATSDSTYGSGTNCWVTGWGDIQFGGKMMMMVIITNDDGYTPTVLQSKGCLMHHIAQMLKNFS